MKKIKIFLAIFFTSAKIIAQNPIVPIVDGIFLLKLHIYTNSYVFTNDTFMFKNRTTLADFIDNTIIVADTLPSNIFGYGEYLFLSVNIDDKIKFSTLNLKRTSLVVSGDNRVRASKYVIAINGGNGKSFRITGFDENDLYAFWEDVKENNPIYPRSLSAFLKHHYIEGLDLVCLFKSANKPYNPIKYPCSKRCSDILRIH